MARFKLVKISRRRVEVQKVRLKVQFGILLFAFACAFLVWLYIKGTQLRLDENQPAESVTAETETMAEAETDTDGTFAATTPISEDGGNTGEV